MVSLQQAVAARRGAIADLHRADGTSTVLENSPAHEDESNGLIERAVQ